MSLEQEILCLEKRFWQSMIDRDPKLGASLTADPCIVTGAQGVGKIDRRTFAAMMEGGSWKLHRFEFSDVKFTEVTKDVAGTAGARRRGCVRATAGRAHYTPNRCSATPMAATARRRQRRPPPEGEARAGIWRLAAHMLRQPQPPFRPRSLPVDPLFSTRPLAHRRRRERPAIAAEHA